MKAAAIVYRTGAAGCLLGVLALWPIVRRRERTAPGVDRLAFVPARYWLWLIPLLGAAALVASFVPAALRWG